ncbi:hypothetical protein EYW49_02380 [Siculibacillus lacustris]|uniref:DUF2267 domain-containing protein n=1 Tax=Siculibacillus lacustris TaxID=1549641 RepID=A0A4Q9VXA4_9HYPH|nr:hypothetical protein [Siculibacillus lacustris]TBW41020.1 hypothetical protein EYW49_02380 [Siculibacillus lacustris]
MQQDLIDTLAGQVGIEPALAEKATSMIVNFLSNQASPELTETIRQYLPNFDAIAATGAAHTAAAEAADGATGVLGGLTGGGLMGALGSLMGGDGAIGQAMALLGHLGKDGLEIGQVQALAGGLIGHLRQVAGDEVVDRLVAEIPGVGHFLG